MLTNESGMFYAESLNLIHRLSHPSDLRIFCIPAGLSRAGNILNTSQSYVSGLVSQPHLILLGKILKRIHIMTNTIINSLYSQYQQLKTVSGTDRREVLAVLDKLVNTPTITPEDRKIKFSVGCEYVELFNQIAAE